MSAAELLKNDKIMICLWCACNIIVACSYNYLDIISCYLEVTLLVMCI